MTGFRPCRYSCLGSALIQNSMHASNNTHDPIAVSMLFVIAFVFWVCVIVSYKKGKILNGFVRSGESPFIDRKLDPEGYWVIFIILFLLCAFTTGFAIWALIHVNVSSNDGPISN